jgi:hypothetical protein
MPVVHSKLYGRYGLLERMGLAFHRVLSSPISAREETLSVAANALTPTPLPRADGVPRVDIMRVVWMAWGEKLVREARPARLMTSCTAAGIVRQQWR